MPYIGAFTHGEGEGFLPIVAFDRDDARRSGMVRAMLARAGMPIGRYDGLIAGQALAKDLVVITRNKREFERVPDLRVEDWE